MLAAPEFPPLEIISGMNRARTAALAISVSKNPIAVAVSSSPKNRITNQLARFWIIAPQRRSDVTEHGVAKAGVRRLQPQCILPVDAASDRVVSPNSW